MNQWTSTHPEISNYITGPTFGRRRDDYSDVANHAMRAPSPLRAAADLLGAPVAELRCDHAVVEAEVL